MKKIIYKEKEYNVPQNWWDVKLKDQIKVSDDLKLFKNDLTRKFAIISGYGGIDVKLLKSLNLKNKDNFKFIQEVSNCLDFTSQPIPTIKDKSKFKFKGELYHVSQNLLTVEFQDYVNMQVALQNVGNDTYKALPQLIAILAKRMINDKIETIDDYDIIQRAIEFEELPVPIAESIRVFFCRSMKLSNTLSLLSSQPIQVIQMKVKEVEDILKKLDGKGLLMKLLIGTLKIYVRFINHNAGKFLNTTQSKSFITKCLTTLTKWQLKKRNKKSKKILGKVKDN